MKIRYALPAIALLAGLMATGGVAAASADPLEPPIVIGLSPAGGPEEGGTLLRVLGENLDGVTDVQFGGVPVSSLDVLGESVIEVVIPPGVGIVDVWVVGAAGEFTLPASFAYVPTPPPPPPASGPIVSAVTPSTVYTSGGQTVLVTGEGLLDVSGVWVQNLAVPFTVLSDSELEFQTPPLGESVGIEVRVSTPSGNTVALLDYIQTPLPHLSVADFSASTSTTDPIIVTRSDFLSHVTFDGDSASLELTLFLGTVGWTAGLPWDGSTLTIAPPGWGTPPGGTGAFSGMIPFSVTDPVSGQIVNAVLNFSGTWSSAPPPDGPKGEPPVDTPPAPDLPDTTPEYEAAPTPSLPRTLAHTGPESDGVGLLGSTLTGFGFLLAIVASIVKRRGKERIEGVEIDGAL